MNFLKATPSILSNAGSKPDRAKPKKMRDFELKKLHEAILGVPLREEPSADEMLRLLESGQDNLPVSLRWVEGEPYRHVVLTHLDENRVHFFNPLGPEEELPEGTVLDDEGPQRIYHGPGDESVSESEFRGWFAEREGLGFVPVS